MSEKTYSNSTHLLKCRHQIGRNGFDYRMRCHVLGRTKSGKLKVLVFGNRYWKNYDHLKRIRYVDGYRVVKS